MNECERALLFLISVQRWRCWLGLGMVLPISLFYEDV